MKPVIKSLQHYLLSFLQIQLLLTLVSLPFLIAWGLPLSLLSCIGNFIFSPLLTLFLFLSSVLFFTELLHIPNTFIASCLNTLSSYWATALSYGSGKALIGFAKPSIIALVLLPLIAFYFLINKRIATVSQRVCYYGILLVLIGCVLKLPSINPQPLIKTHKTKSSALTYIMHQGYVSLIDQGAIGRHPSIESYVEYTLIPTLTKLSGALHIDTLVLLHPTKRLFLAIAHLSYLIPIKTIYLASWEGDIKDRKFWRSFWNFKNSIEKNKCNLKRIGPKNHTVPLSNSSSLELEWVGSFKKYGAQIAQFTASVSTPKKQYILA